jgi:hypothetical protein
MKATCLEFVAGSHRWGAAFNPIRFADGQGLTLVHVSAKRKRFLWDRGYIQGLFMGCLGRFRGF